jgi:hypothetical protein
MVVLVGLAAPAAHAQTKAPNPMIQGLTLWLSTINGTAMGVVGGAALAALSNNPDKNYRDYMVSGGGLGTLAGMAVGIVSITGLPDTGAGGPAPGRSAPQPGAAFGYTPQRGLWLQAPAPKLYRAGPDQEHLGVATVLVSGRF